MTTLDGTARRGCTRSRTTGLLVARQTATVQSLVADTNRARPSLGEELPPGLPGLDTVRLQAKSENFPVAPRVLPRPPRATCSPSTASPGWPTTSATSYDGDRLAALDWLEGDLDARTRAAGPPSRRLRRLTPTIRAPRPRLDPFRDLIEANRRDQASRRYATFDELLDYCRLSANPVGRLVLAISAAPTPDAPALSDDVCSGLQVVEHLQDVGEDAAAGRVLPARRRPGAASACTDDDLPQPTASASRPRAASPTSRPRHAILLAAGQPLVAVAADGPGRLAVAGFVAGGLAAARRHRAPPSRRTRPAAARPDRGVASTLRHALLARRLQTRAA